tara:strand:+ start:4643 stop:5065 length:423 start_codon:yes stop_codon:yes gene_type:complete
MSEESDNQVIPGCGTHHVAIQSRNWDASIKLYQNVLGMKIIAEFGTKERKIILLNTGDGSHIELFQPTADSPHVDDPIPNDPVTHIALKTSDTRAATEHVRKHGYEITVEPKTMDLGGLDVTLAFFKGPSGEVIEFFEVH